MAKKTLQQISREEWSVTQTHTELPRAETFVVAGSLQRIAVAFESIAASLRYLTGRATGEYDRLARTTKRAIRDIRAELRKSAK